MFCGKQVDEIGKECVEEGKYKYKGQVDIPPLSMIDDLISISECGHKTAMDHAYIKCKTSSKKLQKCKKIHIGKSHEEHKCQPLYVDKWEEKEVEDFETGIIKIEDSCESEDVMEEKSEEKYLGDVISRDGRNIKNIQSRVNKGTGIVRKILTILDGIPFGKYHFEAGIILRNSLLVSSVLFNSEAWYNITKAELELIESVDLMLLRGILKAPKSTPKEMLFLELGILPLREIIRKRRLAFLHYILHENKDSMISRVFETQRRNKTSKDWVTTVLSDLKEINLNMTLEEIRNMKKQTFINIIKRKIEYKSLKYLEKMKEKHSKVDSLKHPVLKMQPYLMPNDAKMKKEECQMIFQMRCRVTDTKVNQKNRYDSHECEACGLTDESQNHVLNCKVIIEMHREFEISEIPPYENIMEGNVNEQANICKIFSKHLKILQNLKKKVK